MPRFLHAACRRADLVTCLNSRERTFLETSGWASPERVVPLSHGVPPVFFAPPREVRATERLLFVGQWRPMKGVADLRDAFVALARQYPSLTLTCAGTLADIASVLGDFPVDLRPRVRVVPRIDRDELARLYRDSDAFVFPSLYEGFSRAIVEAMASGLPIVTTQVGVAIDALVDGASAMIVPPARPDALVSAVDALVRDPALAASLGGNARAAADRYHEDRTTRDAAAVLVALAARRGRTGTGKAV